MTNNQLVYLDEDDWKLHHHRSLFYNNGSARCNETMLLLEQLILDVPKRTKIYYKNHIRLDCTRENLSLTPFEMMQSDKSADYKGVEFRKRPHRLAILDREGWYAVTMLYNKEQIAGPFKTDKEAAEAYNLITGTETNKVEPFKPTGGRQLESVIQKDIVKFLTLRGWLVHETNMNHMEQGWPDLNAMHPKYGVRFIDVKRKERWIITPAQQQDWPMMHQFGFGPYIMTGANEAEYQKLFGPPNYMDYFSFTGDNTRDIMNIFRGKT